MTTPLTLRTRLEKRGPAAAILLTDEQVQSLGTAKTPPVTVTIGGRTARLRIGRMGGENLIGMSKAARATLDVEAGDVVDVIIAVDADERTVDVPPDLETALSGAPGLAEKFAALSHTKRKEFARSVADAKQPETRQRRIARILADLGG